MEKKLEICFNIVFFSSCFMWIFCKDTSNSWMTTVHGNGQEVWYAGCECLVCPGSSPATNHLPVLRSSFTQCSTNIYILEEIPNQCLWIRPLFNAQQTSTYWRKYLLNACEYEKPLCKSCSILYFVMSSLPVQRC